MEGVQVSSVRRLIPLIASGLFFAIALISLILGILAGYLGSPEICFGGVSLGCYCLLIGGLFGFLIFLK